MRKWLTKLILFALLSANVADAVPDNFNGKFIFPLPTRVRVSGSFAELRSSHIHRGVDVRTMGLMGIPVMAVADGYVFALHASNLYRGFGQAVYLAHDDNMRSTYGHLFSFSHKHNLQAAFELYSQMTEGAYFFVNQPPEKFRVKQGDVIAYTGDKGSGTAHLHYEIADADKNHYNPVAKEMLNVPDTTKPGFSRLQVILHNRKVNGKSRFYCKPAKISSSEYLCKNPLPADGKISFKVTVWDHMNAPNSTAVSKVTVELAGRVLYRTDTDKMPRSASAAHRKLFDAYGAGKGYTYKLYWPENERREPPFFVKEHADRGYADLSGFDDVAYLPGKIEATDAQGNTSILHFNVVRTDSTPALYHKPSYNIAKGKSRTFKAGKARVKLPVQKSRAYVKVTTLAKPKKFGYLSPKSNQVNISYYSEGKSNAPVTHFSSAYHRNYGIYNSAGRLVSQKYDMKSRAYQIKGSGRFFLAADTSRPFISTESSYGPMDKLYLVLPVTDSGSGIDEGKFQVSINGNALKAAEIQSWKIRYDRERRALLIPTGFFPDRQAASGGTLNLIRVTAADRAGNRSRPYEGYIYLKNKPEY